MAKVNATLQEFEYRKHWPFHVYEVKADPSVEEILPHWHSELEVVYLFSEDDHYIDGEHFHCQEGDFIVTNSNAIHKIDTKGNLYDNPPGKLAGIVVLMQEDFVKTVLPNYKEMYFTNTNQKATPGIKRTMMKIRQFAEMEESMGKEDAGEYDYLLLSSLIVQLLYYMCERGVVKRKAIDNVGEKKIDRLKEVILYLETHYMDDCSEKEIAERFYFSPSYFSRIFKQTTGMTFHKFLTYYRLKKAKERMDTTEETQLEIALACGFTDSRRLAIAFKEQYGITPREYKKAYEKLRDHHAVEMQIIKGQKMVIE